MTPLRIVAVVASLLALANAGPRPTMKQWKAAKAAKEQNAAAEAADNKKRGAVDKVIEMLGDLRTKVVKEGLAEAKSYNKFTCFCQSMKKAKGKAIKSEKDTKRSLRASIEKLSDGKKADKKSIRGFEKKIVNTNENSNKEMKDNADAMKKYAEEKADLEKAISSLENGLKTLKVSKPSMLQMESVSSSIDETLAMADALGLLQGPTASLLQGAPNVEMENYKFHSGGVIGTLEKLLGTFRDKKAKSDAAEVKRLQAHDSMMQNQQKMVKAKTLEVKDTTKAKDDKTVGIAEDNKALSTENAALLDDTDYMRELFRMCEKKAQTYELRSKVRTDELSALTAAASIVKNAVREKTSSASIRFVQRGVSVRIAEAVAGDDEAMDALEEAAEEEEPSAATDEQEEAAEAPVEATGDYGSSVLGALSFLERRQDDAADRISQFLQTEGGKTGSTVLTSLALEISTEKPKGFEKIKTLISELIKRLQGQASKEATQKGWCDKSIGDATRKKVSASSAVEDLTDSLRKLKADRATMIDTMAKLADEIEDLNDAQAKASKMRKEEEVESTETVTEATDGLAAVRSAIKILDKFYNKAAKGKDTEFKTTKKVVDHTPNAGFAGGEAYKGSQSSATGVVAMLDVIESDFARTISMTKKAEKLAVQDFKAMSDQTETSLMEKAVITKARKKEKSDADSKIRAQKVTLKRQSDLLAGSVQELAELKKACDAPPMSYAERVARREDEIASLNKALKII